MRDGDPQILCIGDGVQTDVQGGIAEGLDVLFITGGIDTAAFGADSSNPNKELLENWLTARQLSPSFAMGHLR
jgi:ribonucleotide monophosphatase NagD (HAD superfamily)